MKNRASGLVKQIIAALRAMAKSKALALKTKTKAIKARLIIFALLRNKKFLMSSLSHKFHSALGHHHPKEECFLEDECHQNHQNDPSKAIVVYNDDNAYSYETLPNPTHTHLVEDKSEDGYESYYRYDEEEERDDNSKYPDLTHSLFETEDLDFRGSVIDLVKNSKEEAGEEFKLEDEIDHVADLFIERFRRQMILQKQQSIKRHHEEMLQKGA